MLLCKEGELADGTYLDAATARSVRVEHVGARILSTEEAEEKARSPKVCVFTQQPAWACRPEMWPETFCPQVVSGFVIKRIVL